MVESNTSDEEFFYLPYLRPILILTCGICIDLLQ